MFQVIFISCYWCLFVCCVFSCKPLHISSEWIWFFFASSPTKHQHPFTDFSCSGEFRADRSFCRGILEKKTQQNYDFQAENCSFQESNHHLLICSCLISLKTKHCAHGVIKTIPTKSLTPFFFFLHPIISCNDHISLTVDAMNVLIQSFSDLQEPEEMSAESVSSGWLPIRPLPLTFFLLLAAWRLPWLRPYVVLICLPRPEWRPAQRTFCLAAAAAGNKPNSWPHFASLKTFYYTVIYPAVWWAVTLWAMSPYRMLMNWNDKIIMCCWTHQYRFFF